MVRPLSYVWFDLRASSSLSIASTQPGCVETSAYVVDSIIDEPEWTMAWLEKERSVKDTLGDLGGATKYELVTSLRKMLLHT